MSEATSGTMLEWPRISLRSSGLRAADFRSTAPSTSLRAKRSNPSFRARGDNGLVRFARNDEGVSRMSGKSSPPVPRFTVITLGVSDMRASIAFYEALGFARKFHATGEAVAFFDTGGTVIALFPWDQLTRDATLPDQPRPK